MTKGKLVAAGIAAGAVVALLAIPKTRKMIMCSLGGLTDSVKDMVAGSAKLPAHSKTPGS